MSLADILFVMKYVNLRIYSSIISRNYVSKASNYL
jgi:hypothetical protein